MKKIIKILILLIILISVLFIAYLSTAGIKTNKLNPIISKELKKNYPKIDITFDTIILKLDIKKLNLYGATFNPKVSYLKNDLPITYVKIYLDLYQLIKSKKPIDTVELAIEEIEIEKIKKILVAAKPSSFKKIIFNNLSKGKIKSVINIEFDEEFKIKNYRISGKVKNINLLLSDRMSLNKTSFNFIADNNLTLLNSIKSNFKDIPITNGSIKILKETNYKIEGSITTDLKLNNNNIKKFSELKLIDFKYFENQFKFSSKIISKFDIILSNSLNLEKYNLELDGSIKEAELTLNKSIKADFLSENIKSIFLSKVNLKAKFNKAKDNSLTLEGFFRTDNNKANKFSIQSISNKNITNYLLNFDFNNEIKIKMLNYEKDINSTANLFSEFETRKSQIKIKKITFKENKNLISIDNVILEKNKLKKFNKVIIKTFKNNLKNNDFEISFSDKIKILGSAYDSSNLGSIISKEEKSKLFSKINKDIEISFEKIFTRLSEPLSNFNLIGSIKNGKFIKISSKTEFLPNKYLDISLRKIANSNNKILEIYSDITKPLLAEHSFFKSIEGGNLLFISTFNDKFSSSNLLIKNFKVSEAPAFAKLLALADLGGMADLLKGEGLSFDTLEIKFNSDKDILNITEIYAVGPSISILMEGYVDKKSKVTSLKGTMVPAKELNKLIAKIPILGDILIPKEIGEGLFGVSFKIKGPPKNMKTSVNPIKSLTPRFITKALEKRKKN